MRPAPLPTETGLTFVYLRYTEPQSNRVFVTVECRYSSEQTIADGMKRIVKLYVR
jgi:hypothetical protein